MRLAGLLAAQVISQTPGYPFTLLTSGPASAARIPTDRAKMGTKKSLLVKQHGGPLGVRIAGVNVHDTKLLAECSASRRVV
jgi:hypothetical protein